MLVDYNRDTDVFTLGPGFRWKGWPCPGKIKFVSFALRIGILPGSFRPSNDQGRRIRDQTVQNIRFLQFDGLRLGVAPPGQAGDRGAGHDPAEKPDHVLIDVRVSGHPNPVSKRFGGDIVPGGEIRKRKDEDSEG